MPRLLAFALRFHLVSEQVPIKNKKTCVLDPVTIRQCCCDFLISGREEAKSDKVAVLMRAMSVFVAGSMLSITGPLPVHLPLKTPQIGLPSVGNPKVLQTSLITRLIEEASGGLTNRSKSGIQVAGSKQKRSLNA